MAVRESQASVVETGTGGLAFSLFEVVLQDHSAGAALGISQDGSGSSCGHALGHRDTRPQPPPHPPLGGSLRVGQIYSHLNGRSAPHLYFKQGTSHAVGH